MKSLEQKIIVRCKNCGWRIFDILKVSRTTVYELLKSKKFHSVRVGGQYRISKKSFENWLNGEKGGSEDGIC